MFQAEYIHNEKLKVLQALRPGNTAFVDDWAIAGQYAASAIGGQRVKAYVDEDRVAPDSRTETFVAMEVAIDNWRWAGVPFYLRTGKQLAQGRRVITIAFKEPPQRMFPLVAAGSFARTTAMACLRFAPTAETLPMWPCRRTGL